MPRVVKEMTVAELEKALTTKRGKLEKLLGRREKLQRDLERVERQIRGLAGRVAGEGKVRRRRRRAKNEKSLKTYVTELLTRNKKGLTMAELQDRVLEGGYKSRSRNFRNVLYQTLYNTSGISHDKETGRYLLQG